MVDALSLDYGAHLASLDQPPLPAEAGAILANAAADRYQAEHEGACALFEFEQIGATYWFDFASSAALPQEDRTIAAWAITPTNVHRRDVSYQRGSQGKRYRALERAAASTPGALYFGHLLYADDTAYPSQIEMAVLLPGETLRVEQFDNRPAEHSTPAP
jgi:hypothetical protein